jgi:hypothetical protein
MNCLAVTKGEFALIYIYKNKTDDDIYEKKKKEHISHTFTGKNMR